VAPNCFWEQTGEAKIRLSNATSGYAVYFNTGGQWTQNAIANIYAQYSGYSTIARLAKLTRTHTHAYAHCMVLNCLAHVAAVLMNSGTWIQNGDVTITALGNGGTHCPQAPWGGANCMCRP
jgi:hypothetical protein